MGWTLTRVWPNTAEMDENLALFLRMVHEESAKPLSDDRAYFYEVGLDAEPGVKAAAEQAVALGFVERWIDSVGFDEAIFFRLTREGRLAANLPFARPRVWPFSWIWRRRARRT